MPGPVSLTLMYWPPEAVQPTFSQISPPCGVNLMRVGQEVEADLAHRPLVGPQPRHVRLEQFVDGDAAIAGAQLEQMVAILDHAMQRHRLLVELVAAGFDAREIEDFVDEVEKMHAGIVNVAGIVLVRRHGVRAENLAPSSPPRSRGWR